MKRRESPIKRANAQGKVTWYARYTDGRGRRRSAGTYLLKREAQEAIDDAYGRVSTPHTIGAYFETWPTLHPRSDRTNETNEGRIKSVLEVDVDGRAFRDWPIDELRRRHALALVDHMLRIDGRATTGVVGVLRALSAMAEDAITDEVAQGNAFRGVKVRRNDPRARKQPREIRVWSWEQMHDFAAAAGSVRTTKTVDSRGRRLPAKPSQLDRWRAVYAEAMVRVFSDAGLRLGEVLPLERLDLAEGVFTVKATAHEGTVTGGTKREHLRGQSEGDRPAPCPPTLGSMIRGLPARIDTRLIFPTSTGALWRERNFYRDVWYPAQAESGLDIRPHEMRHSWITHLRAAGIDDADLADMAGHELATMLGRYTHPLRESFDQVRDIIG
jgi:integrase